MSLIYNIKNKLRRIKRAYYIRKYRLRNVSKKFLATRGLKRVSKDILADDYSYIGPNCLIYPKVKIGKFSILANNVSILGSDHNYRIAGTPIIFSGRDELCETIIGRDVWIGAYSIIMTGVKIGDGAIVAAGSVVTKDVLPYSIYAGIPARKIKDRFSEQEQEIHKKMLSDNMVDWAKIENTLPNGKI